MLVIFFPPTHCGGELCILELEYACGHMDVGRCPHQVLAATLTLSQPEGQIMPTLYWCPHQVLKATGMPDTNSSVFTALIIITPAITLIIFGQIYQNPTSV